MTDAASLAAIIETLEFGATEVPVESHESIDLDPYPAPLPGDAPVSFAKPFRAAREAGRPIIVDFWAEWCAPCVRLKRETLSDPMVATALEGVEVIFVDLDEYPSLAAAYDVSSIPDVFFIDPDGYVTDRLRAFEEPDEFLGRLAKLAW